MQASLQGTSALFGTRAESQRARANLGTQTDEPIVGAYVADRVGDQVAQRLGKPIGVAAQAAPRDLAELEAADCEKADLVPQLVHELREVDCL